jgi:DNA processing protein
LALRGLTIVSGLGSESTLLPIKARLAQIQEERVGVLGCGIEVIYPKENRKIFAEIEERGAIISEFPMGTYPAP